MPPALPARPPLAALLVLLLLAAWLSTGPARAGDVVSVDATATVVVTAVPGRKEGGRDLAYALGKDPADAARSEMEAELRDLRAFREIVPDGGEYRLEVAVGRLRREYRELADIGDSQNTLTVSLAGTAAWWKGTEKLQEAPVEVETTLSLDEAPGKRDLQRAIVDLVHDLAKRAFADLYEARFFESLGGTRPGAR